MLISPGRITHADVVSGNETSPRHRWLDVDGDEFLVVMLSDVGLGRG